MAADRIGLKIKRARERLRWTQAQLADAIGVTQKTIDNWEHDKSYPKSSVGALEDVLAVSLDAGTAQASGLPPLVAANQDDERVMEIWSLRTIPPRSREGLIATLLEQDGPLRRRA